MPYSETYFLSQFLSLIPHRGPTSEQLLHIHFLCDSQCMYQNCWNRRWTTGAIVRRNGGRWHSWPLFGEDSILHTRLLDRVSLTFRRCVNKILLVDRWSGPCQINNGGCDQFCFPTSSTSRSCGCATGFFLHSDGLQCIISK